MGEARRRYSARNGVERTMILNEGSPQFVVRTSQDVEPILDSIARDREIMPHGENKLAARLPLIVYEELQRLGIADDPDLFRAWLNSSDADPWRIWRGRL
jgi:hypothetical protein